MHRHNQKQTGLQCR